MSANIKVTLKKLTNTNLNDALAYIDEYNGDKNKIYEPCPYTKESIESMVKDSSSLLYGTYVDGKMVAISGVTIDVDDCIDFIYKEGLDSQNNLKFTPFSILPAMMGKDILKTSTLKLIDYVASMNCENLLCVCSLDNIIDSGIAKKLGMDMVENYDNNNRKIFILKIVHAE